MAAVALHYAHAPPSQIFEKKCCQLNFDLFLANEIIHEISTL